MQISKTLTVGLIFGIFSNSTLANDDNQVEPAFFDSTDKWQIYRLFKPTESQREKEEKTGQVMIYDGLPDTTVAKAIDTNFKRIQNMMFTRVVVTKTSGDPELDEYGNAVVEDDGCD